MKKCSTVMRLVYIALIMMATIFTNIFVVFANHKESDYQDSFRPQFHFSPQKNWMNDPNGLVYDPVNQEWHLFFQHNPSGMHWGNISWGHAISKDLLHWTEAKVALTGEVWSGCAVYDADNTSGFFEDEDGIPKIVLVFSGAQGIGLAICDRNATEQWKRIGSNPVIKGNYLDPKVIWLDETQEWLMVVRQNGKLVLFTSNNLIEWTFESEICNRDSSQIESECPDLYPLTVDGDENTEKWILNLAGHYYYIGDLRKNSEDRWEYIVESEEKVYNLKTEYATQTFFNDGASQDPSKGSADTNGRRLAVGWLWDDHSDDNGLYHGIEKPWNGIQTIVQEVKLKYVNGELQLYTFPVNETETLRSKLLYEVNDLTVNSEDSNILDGVKGTLFDIDVVLNPDEYVEEFGFKLRAGEKYRTVIKWDAEECMLQIDRRLSGAFRSIGEGIISGKLEKNECGEIRLRILVDASVIGVYGNEGQMSANFVYFPNTENNSIEFYVKGGSITIKSMTIYRMSSTHNPDDYFYNDASREDTQNTEFNTSNDVDTSKTSDSNVPNIGVYTGITIGVVILLMTIAVIVLQKRK